MLGDSPTLRVAKPRRDWWDFYCAACRYIMIPGLIAAYILIILKIEVLTAPLGRSLAGGLLFAFAAVCCAALLLLPLFSVTMKGHKRDRAWEEHRQYLQQHIPPKRLWVARSALVGWMVLGVLLLLLWPSFLLASLISLGLLGGVSAYLRYFWRDIPYTSSWASHRITNFLDLGVALLAYCVAQSHSMALFVQQQFGDVGWWGAASIDPAHAAIPWLSGYFLFGWLLISVLSFRAPDTRDVRLAEAELH